MRDDQYNTPTGALRSWDDDEDDDFGPSPLFGFAACGFSGLLIGFLLTWIF